MDSCGQRFYQREQFSLTQAFNGTYHTYVVITGERVTYNPFMVGASTANTF